MGAYMDNNKVLIMKAIDSINITAELFYQQNVQEGYIKLKQTLDIISNLANITYIDKVEQEENTNIVNSINEILNQALQAMEQGDTILLSDILSYDLKELLEKNI